MKKCALCGSTENLKQGWTMGFFCCEQHEREVVSKLLGSMPGAGPVPRPNWVPLQISLEISERWEEEI